MMSAESDLTKEGAAVESIELPDLGAAKQGKPLVMRTLDVIRDVKVQASVMLGKTAVSVDRLFSMREGDVLELDQDISAPVDVLVEGHLVAQGQIVVVGNRFGILITDIAAP